MEAFSGCGILSKIFPLRLPICFIPWTALQTLDYRKNQDLIKCGIVILRWNIQFKWKLAQCYWKKYVDAMNCKRIKDTVRKWWGILHQPNYFNHHWYFWFDLLNGNKRKRKMKENKKDEKWNEKKNQAASSLINNASFSSSI